VIEGPAVIEEEIQKSATENAEDVGDQIIYMEKLSQDPQNREIGKNGGTGGNMIS
jgi:hypothetical protein